MDFALDLTTGDIGLNDQGNIYLVDGIDAIVQHLFIRFRFFLGEWAFDTSLGMPWFQDVLIKAPSFAVIQEVCKNEILSTPGITSLQNFDLNLDFGARACNLSFNAICQQGPINFNQLIELPVVG